MSDQIKLSIRDFRAIKEADIKLNGITVVSGVNGSGKSTLSKFLYYTFLHANNYDDFVIDQLSDSLYDINRFIYLLEREVSTQQGLDVFNFFDNEFNLRSFEFLTIKLNEIIEHVKSLAKIYENKQNNQSVNKNNANRIINTLRNTLDITNSNKDFNSLIEKLCLQIQSKFVASLSTIEKRPKKVLISEIEESFADNFVFPRLYSVSEYDVPIISNASKFVPIVHSVENIAYIDTPMQMGVAEEKSYWDDLDRILRTNKFSNPTQSVINDIIQNDILKGESEFEEVSDFSDDYAFKFKRDDGYVYNLLEVATGVKSFSILQLLLKNGFLTKNTLLIIDEPEAHLHPQWIVEYARMIVLLSKEIGVKFFIASHSPDMVSAIKYISEKEQTTQNLEYYLAVQTKENPYLFNYKSLGTNIDPIFESFNIALDRINQYGVSNEHNDLF